MRRDDGTHAENAAPHSGLVIIVETLVAWSRGSVRGRGPAGRVAFGCFRSDDNRPMKAFTIRLAPPLRLEGQP